MRGISTILEILLILLILISLVSLFWSFASGTIRSITQSGTNQTQRAQEVLSSCMIVESINENKVYIRNCGDGIISNDSLNVYLDDAPIGFNMTPQTIENGKIGTININPSSLSGVIVGDHDMKISNPNLEIVQKVEAVLPSSCIMDLGFDEGQGNITYDSSGYGNNGFIYGTTQALYSPDSNGYIKDWLFIGTFSESTCACAGGATCTSFISETSTSKYSGLIENGNTWFEHHNSDYLIDLDNEVFPPGANYVVAYAYAVVYSPTTRNVQLRVASDDGVKVWLNNNLVDNNGGACRSIPPTDNDIISVTLNQGYNYLLVRVGDFYGDWRLALRFTDSSGNPQTDLKIGLDSRAANIQVNWVDGKFGKALGFDGTNNIINIINPTNLNSLNNGFTIEAWIKPYIANHQGFNRIIWFNNFLIDFAFTNQVNGVAAIWFVPNSTWLPGNTPLTLGQWYHVAATFSANSGNVDIYVNGKKDGEYNVGHQSVTTLSGNIDIGNVNDLSRGFNGTIDSVRIYNQVLTPDQTIMLKMK